ncbi:hypothetical protein SJI19_12075 [Acerihabitans sp. TG2]|uniref:hypothetical protein n=1 Tax=Acerihabitans sp. TG2 TaxID=3096008 RepID=UPI002B2306B9|nr:hypothetical protein [Acerihabitans sp. TG2]MEA9391270.1 hypothetical protein [Acerihabitans sp. TG2]
MTALFERRSDWPAFEQAAPSVIAALRMLGKAIDDSELGKKRETGHGYHQEW